MNKFGDFSADAYEALRSAYADQINNPIEEENAGYDLAGMNFPLETEDASGDYLGKTGLWSYPSGHSDYEKPDPDSLITALQTTDSEEEIEDLIDEILGEEIDEEEEIDALIDEVLGEEIDDDEE
jgi:hypothetical protein